MEQMPSVGRTVHYFAHGTTIPTCQAAIITHVDLRPALGQDDPPGTYVGLAVMAPTGMSFIHAVPYAAAPEKAGTWHWPERV